MPHNDYEKLANDELKINEQIRAKEVRLIDNKGTMVGVVPIFRALAMARAASLDLVEVSPGTEPPVCKLADYGKIRYRNQKKASEVKKKQKIVEIKEIKLSLNIAEGDYNTKLKQARKFFEQGNKVRFSFQFKGREIIHSNLVMDMAEKIIGELSDVAKTDVKPQVEGKKLFFMMSSTVKK